MFSSRHFRNTLLSQSQKESVAARGLFCSSLHVPSRGQCKGELRGHRAGDTTWCHSSKPVYDTRLQERTGVGRHLHEAFFHFSFSTALSAAFCFGRYRGGATSPPRCPQSFFLFNTTGFFSSSSFFHTKKVAGQPQRGKPVLPDAASARLRHMCLSVTITVCVRVWVRACMPTFLRARRRACSSPFAAPPMQCPQPSGAGPCSAAPPAGR